MAPTAPRYNRPETRNKILQAGSVGIKDTEMIHRLKLAERHFYQCKAGGRGLSPGKLSLLDEMIAIRLSIKATLPPNPHQRAFDFDSAFESITPIQTVGSPFDLRFMKKRQEQVWMVEIRPRKSGQLQAAVSLNDQLDDIEESMAELPPQKNEN